MRAKKKSNEVFRKYLRNRRRLFQKQRATLARKLENPRLLQIKFHTFRHWKTTNLYHQTKDIVYVQQFLGHKTINHTLKYIQLSEARFHDNYNFNVKVAKTHEEAISLLEAGFNKVDEFDDLHLYRKLK